MNDWQQKDARYNWHPYTQMSTLEDDPPLPIESADGVKLYDADGNWYYDTIASWWCNVHGHGHPRIREAVQRQMGKLDHTLFAAVAHEPAAELGERLVNMTPAALRRVFYSDDGSTAVEVALKMSLQSWRNRDREDKELFICLDPGYHGDTIGCMSVSGVDLFRRPFGPVMFDSVSVPAPFCYRCPVGEDADSCEVECLGLLEEALERHAGQTAGLIMEPLLLAAGGMITYPESYLSGAAQLARKYGAHFILDEVATGFGRTGQMLACRKAGVSPDFLCLSKGITGGTLPLAATLTTRDVFESFLGPVGSEKTFYHGHTYTANPAGCAAALASLDLFEEEDTLENVSERSAQLREGTADMQDLPHVGEVRHVGMMAALELVKDEETRERLPDGHEILRSIYRAGLERNVILRPIGNVVYLFPPLCTTEDELADMLDRAEGALQEVLRGT